jgi:hypothetical protein
MEQITTIGLDIAKHVFHVHAVISRRPSRPRLAISRSLLPRSRHGGNHEMLRVSAFPLWTPLKVQAVFERVVRSRMLPSVRPLLQPWAAGPYGSSRTGATSP